MLVDPIMDLSERPSGDFVRHPWEITRCSYFQKVVVREQLNCDTSSVLDIGSGDAWFAKSSRYLWKPDARFVCWDQAYRSVDLVTEGPLQFVKDRPVDLFDVILMLDVLEHIENDVAFLSDLVQKNLKPGGKMLVSVPSWPFLYSNHDRHLKHFRRYLPSQIQAVLLGSGLELLSQGGLFHSLLLPRLFTKILENPLSVEHLHPPELRWRGGKLSFLGMSAALQLDCALSHASRSLGLNLPGLSWWGVCQRK